MKNTKKPKTKFVKKPKKQYIFVVAGGLLTIILDSRREANSYIRKSNQDFSWRIVEKKTVNGIETIILTHYYSRKKNLLVL